MISRYLRITQEREENIDIKVLCESEEELQKAIDDYYAGCTSLDDTPHSLDNHFKLNEYKVIVLDGVEYIGGGITPAEVRIATGEERDCIHKKYDDLNHYEVAEGNLTYDENHIITLKYMPDNSEFNSYMLQYDDDDKYEVVPWNDKIIFDKNKIILPAEAENVKYAYIYYTEEIPDDNDVCKYPLDHYVKVDWENHKYTIINKQDKSNSTE